MRITLRQLELFTAICQEQTVTAGATRVGLSQAATSQALAELENLLERKLFDRHGRRLVLNAAGRRLLPSAIEVLDRIRDIESSGVRQPVRVAIYASLTAGNYMPLLSSHDSPSPIRTIGSVYQSETPSRWPSLSSVLKATPDGLKGSWKIPR
jgi:DNA-binding transcriptional LysR family regulator